MLWCSISGYWLGLGYVSAALLLPIVEWPDACYVAAQSTILSMCLLHVLRVDYRTQSDQVTGRLTA